MIDRHFVVDHETIMRIARQEQAKAVRQMMTALTDFIFRRKVAKVAVTA